MISNFFASVSRFTYVTAVLLCLLLISNVELHAQVNKVQKSLDLGDLPAAKRQINELLQIGELSQDAKIWHLKGWIYKELYIRHPEQDKDSLYRSTALEALATSTKLDKAKTFKEENKRMASFLIDSYFNDGKKAFDNKLYSDATHFFATYQDRMLSTDSTAVDHNAFFYAGYSAWLAQDNEKAERYLTRSVNHKPQPMAYVVLAKLKLATGDTTESYNLINEAAKKYPANKDIAITRANLYLLSKKYEEALGFLEASLMLDSNDTELLMVTASTLEKLAAKNNFKEVRLAKASVYYYKILESEPENFIANYNLGTIIYNKALEEVQSEKKSIEVDMLLLEKESKDKADKFKAALPYLERALAIEPAHKEALTALEAIYYNLDNTVKYNEVKARLEKVKEQGKTKAAAVDL
jgi:tetratricopeptide (TPR) repeat protein